MFSSFVFSAGTPVETTRKRYHVACGSPAKKQYRSPANKQYRSVFLSICTNVFFFPDQLVETFNFHRRRLIEGNDLSTNGSKQTYVDMWLVKAKQIDEEAGRPGSTTRSTKVGFTWTYDDVHGSALASLNKKARALRCGHRSVPRTRIRPKTLSPRRFEAHGPSFLRRYPWRAKQLDSEWRGETGPDPATGACVDASRRHALLPLLRRPAWRPTTPAE